MKISLFFFLSIVFTSFTFGDDIHLIYEVENYLNNIKTLSTDFKQFVPLNQQGYSLGRLCVSKPGMLRFDYSHPKKLTIILRDKNIMYYDHELQEVSYIRQQNYFFSLFSKKNIKLGDDIQKITLINNEIFLYINKIINGVSTDVVMRFFNNPIALKEVRVKVNDSEEYVLYLSNTEYNINLDKKLFALHKPQFNSSHH